MKTFSERIEELRRKILSAPPEDQQKAVDYLNARLEAASTADNFPSAKGRPQ